MWHKRELRGEAGPPPTPRLLPGTSLDANEWMEITGECRLCHCRDRRYWRIGVSLPNPKEWVCDRCTKGVQRKCSMCGGSHGFWVPIDSKLLDLNEPWVCDRCLNEEH